MLYEKNFFPYCTPAYFPFIKNTYRKNNLRKDYYMRNERKTQITT